MILQELNTLSGRGARQRSVFTKQQQEPSVWKIQAPAHNSIIQTWPSRKPDSTPAQTFPQLTSEKAQQQNYPLPKCLYLAMYLQSACAMVTEHLRGFNPSSCTSPSPQDLEKHGAAEEIQQSLWKLGQLLRRPGLLALQPPSPSKILHAYRGKLIIKNSVLRGGWEQGII